MKRKLSFLLLLLFGISSCVNSDKLSEGISLLPKPSSIVVNDDTFTISPKTTIGFDNSDKDLCSIAEYFNSKISPAAGYKLATAKSGDINLIFDPSLALENGAYILNVNKRGIEIKSSSYPGLFYGIQSLIQLLPAEVKSKKMVDNLALNVPGCTIEDTPEFQWRGLMLDVSRHWFTKEEVMQYIDQLAEYKMNVFHWHLTDDQGWRIEIKSRPELTKKGALRGKRVGQWWKRERLRENEEPTYGGYYTQEDIKEVLDYAAKRYVTVVPEIDVPGHSLATLVAYPELACFKAPDAVNVGNTFYGTDENSLCVGNPSTLEFMEDVLREVSELFPSEYIHIGGDECYKGFWSKCPKCQKLKKSLGLETENELQGHFIKELEKILTNHNKKLLGWDEIHEGGLAPQANVMSWRGMQGGIDAAKAGHHVVMTPNNHCYLDLYQGDPSGEPDTYSMCRLKDTYAFEPVPEGVDKKFILGGQGNLWAESVPTFRHAQYMTWPRGWAIAEILWSGADNKNWNDFISRVEKQFVRADYAEINYARSMYNPIISPFQENDVVYIDLSTELEGLDIYYTFDNTNPDSFGPKYSEPLTIPDGATWLKVITYRDGKPIGKELTLVVSDLVGKSAGRKRP